MTRSVAAVVSAVTAVLILSAVPARAGEKAPVLSKTDQLLVRAQKVCPVSGKDLFSMGGPVRAEVGGQTIFLCCKGCLGRPMPQERWARVNTNLIAAQGTCPVRNKPLPANPTSVVVKNRRIFVCCEPCIEKIKADPDKYVGLVNGLLERNLRGARK